MKCPKCTSGSLQEGKYLCTDKDYRIIDSNNNLVYIIKEDTIEGDEVETHTNIKYCDWEVGYKFNLCKYIEEIE